MEELCYLILVIVYCIINKSLYNFKRNINVIENLYVIVFFVIFNSKYRFILTGNLFNLYLFNKEAFYNCGCRNVDRCAKDCFAYVTHEFITSFFSVVICCVEAS